jgi:hypothetical protein
MQIDVTLVVSLLSVAVAAMSAGIAYQNYRRGQLDQQMAAARWQREYFADVLRWSDEALLILSEAVHLCDLDSKRCEPGRFFDRKHGLRIRLSAQIDRGRWLFPNSQVEEYGQAKEQAYRGHRPEVLNALVAAYNSISALSDLDGSENAPHRAALDTARRRFTSEIQAVLDPRHRDEEFRRLTGKLQGG